MFIFLELFLIPFPFQLLIYNFSRDISNDGRNYSVTLKKNILQFVEDLKALS